MKFKNKIIVIGICAVHVIQVRFGTGSRITLTGVIEFIKPIKKVGKKGAWA